MDHHSPTVMEQQVCVHISSVANVTNIADDDGSLDHHGSVDNQAKPCDHFMIVDDDDLVKLFVDPSKVNDGSQEKRKKCLSAKKPPKPPRPPRAFSLDAADQKLIKEFAQLSVIKKARIERMKALMQKKANSKASASSNYSSLIAMVFTIVVFMVLLFQGMSCQISCGTLEGSHHETNENGLIFIHEELNPSAHDSV